MIPLVLAIVTTFVFLAPPSIAEHYGLYSGHVPDAQLVFPRKISPKGDFLGDDLEHHHTVDNARPQRRVRRLATDPDQHWLPDAFDERPTLQYDISLGGNPARLLLWPSVSFLGPALRVDRGAPTSPSRDGTRRRRRSVNSTTCHYRGVLQGMRNSAVAVSACGKGLVGFIKTEKEDYWLEPADRQTGRGKRGGAHVVFRRGGRGKGRRRAGKRGRRRRRRHGKDCGTRDPLRSNDTALSWGRSAASGRLAVHVQERNQRPWSKARGGRRPAGEQHTRRARSVSQEKHVEVLLVADQSMTAFHQDGDVETYLLTVMNMVATMYHDPSIGNLVNIVVVRIVLLDDWAQDDLFNVTVNADKTLTRFCRWANEKNPGDETDPHHHDVAVLVTRIDICARRDLPCNTLGVAHVAGMCEPERACSINEDNGIVLAHTIAHELGHNFGMMHDTETSGCPRKADETLHVMTPTFEADNHRLAWSPCSRTTLTAFLDEGRGSCLDDLPTLGGYDYPELPAGSMYDADHQCRLQFGNSEASVCSDLEEICSRLWCEVDGACTSLLQPAAPGTSCGKHKWCQEQECVDIGELPEPVPGGWSSWGGWGPCSRTCGAGVSIMERQCDHPTPRHGGAYCLGERRRYRVCNTQPCPEGAPSFRAVQCASFNNRSYHGANYTWLPYFDSSEPCELFCSDSDDTVIVPWGGAVADGTPCNVGRRDMCIGHVCRKVGCDWTVNSDAVEDRCGVCRGDGSQCDTVSGMYSRPDGYGYTEVVVIPAGARNVLIEELAPSKNFIGIGSSSNSTFYLNGRRRITLPGEYDVAGATALYERMGEKERVRIPGPIKESILVYLIFRGRISNPGLRYQYTMRRPGAMAPTLAWKWSDWAPCSATCGGGHQEMRAVCSAGPDTGGVADEECEAAVGPRPADKVRACAAHACPATWWTGPWQLCPATCGAQASRRRSVLCVHRGRQNMALPDVECDPGTRPSEEERCRDLPPCPSKDDISDLFPVTLSRPASGGRPQDVLDMEGLDLGDMGDLDQDERDFLNSNYTMFLQDLLDDKSVAGEPGNILDKRRPWDAIDTSTPGRAPGPGVWEDDMDLPNKARRKGHRPKKHRAQGVRRKKKNGKNRPITSSPRW